MRDTWSRAEAFVASLSLRERLLVTATAIAVVWALALPLAIDPLTERRQAARTDLESLSARATVAEADLLRLEAELAATSGVEAERELARLERDVAALEARARDARAGLVSPAEMSVALETLLARRAPLRVLRLETEGAEPLGDPGAQWGIYRHRIAVEFEGDFASVLEALRELEALPWPMQWEELRYQVIRHPRARATIRFSTLGTREEWVGA